MQEKYIVLFGAGEIGTRAFLGGVRELCTPKRVLFCDNNPQKVGSSIEGIRVCSFEELLCLKKDNKVARIIITVGQKYVDELLIQCLDAGIEKELIRAINEDNEIVHPEKAYAKSVYSVDGEDCWLKNRFANKTKGVYVDVGANHPYRFSNTLWAYQAGWQGVGIEPDVLNYNKLCKLCPNNINVNVGVSDRAGELDYWAYDESCYNTFVRERAKKLEIIGITPSKIYNVKVVPLQDIFDEYGIHEIDFIDLDVENMELEVLKGIDFEKTTINVLLVEQHAKNVEECIGGEVWRFLKEKGYCLMGKIGNTSMYERMKNIM